MAGLPAAHQTRLQTLLAWRAARIAANVQVAPYGFASTNDMDVIDEVSRVFAETLPDILEVAAALTAWDSALTAMQAELALFDAQQASSVSYEIQAGQALSVTNDVSRDYEFEIGVGTTFLCVTNSHAYKITALGALTYGLFQFPGSPATNGSSFSLAGIGASGSSYYGSVTVQDVGLIKDIARQASKEMARKYQAKMDEVKVIAGIAPAFKSASSEAGACWRDDPGAAFAWVDLSGEYLPAFTDRAYVSVRRVNGELEATNEFGFSLSVACEESLQEGDAITITLSGEGLDGYGVGDRYRLPIVAAAAAPFSGGADGNPTLTWAVRSSIAGALADWDWDPTAPTDYTAAAANLRLTQGGIPYVAGDAWSLAIEGGQLRWRRDAGDWTTEDLFGPPPDLGDGLTLAVRGGAAPSFVAGDTRQFQALATYGADRLRQPREGRAWAWAGETAELDVDLGAVYPLEALLLALHSLPAGAEIMLAGGDTGTTDWEVEPAWRAGPILATLPSGTTARYLRLSLAKCGTGAGIGWLWAGVPWAPSCGVSDLTHVRQYALTRTGGRNALGVYRGAGTGGRWTWDLNQGGALTAENAQELLALLDHVAAQGLEPICLVPDIALPASATLGLIEADEVTLTEHLGYALDGQGLVSVELPFRAVLA